MTASRSARTDLTAHSRGCGAASDVVLVEGAGGWLAPISSAETMADIAGKLALPVIFVVGMRLGCLNHALLTREAIRSRGSAVRRLDRQQVGDGNAAGRAPISKRLASRFGVAPLGIVPRRTGTDPRSDAAPAWAVEAANKLVSP